MSARTLARAEARLGWIWVALFALATMVDGVARQLRRARAEHARELANANADVASDG